MKKKKILLHEYILLGIVAILYILIFSTTTSPLFGEPFAGDSPMFQTIGKYWAQGSLPYVDLWDSKGPVIFFINALGYFIAGSKTGIFLIQIISLFISEIYIYKLYNIVFSKKYSLGLTFLTLFIMLLDYDGNSTEEYLLPLILISFYFIVNWINNYYVDNIIDHKLGYAYFYGITFSFCLLTRLTNAVGLCAAVLVIVLTLIVNRKWENLLKNALMFLLGALTLLIPFTAYFLHNGIFYEALYGTLLYNFDYMSGSSMLYSTRSFISVAKIIIGYSYGMVLLLLGLFEIILWKKRRAAGCIWLAVGMITTIWLLRSNGYLHYGLIAIPYIPIILIEIKQIISDDALSKLTSGIIKMITIVYLIVCIACSPLDKISTFYNYLFIGESETYKQVEIDLLSEVPADELNSFIAYNTNPGIYLQLDIKPYYRFFTMQDWAASRSESLKAMLLETFSTGNAKWILVEGNPDDTLINDILDDRYVCVSEREKPFVNSMYYLFQLQE